MIKTGKLFIICCYVCLGCHAQSDKQIATVEGSHSSEWIESINIKNVYWNFNSSVLLERSYPTLDSLTSYLKDNDIRITVIVTEYNNIEASANFAKKKAQSIVDYLVNKGIDPDRLKSEGISNISEEKIPVSIQILIL